MDLMSEMTETSEIAEADAGADTEGTERMEVPLKDAIGAVMGEDFITGTSITGFDIKDEREMELVTRHFNAVTLGNELKPDAIFGYWTGDRDIKRRRTGCSQNGFQSCRTDS